MPRHVVRARLGAWAAALLLGVTACAGSPGEEAASEVPGSPGVSASGGDTSAPPAEEDPTLDPDTPTGWGPTEGELVEARALAEALSPEELAAVVLMPGFWGQAAGEPAEVEEPLNQRMHGAPDVLQALAGRPYGGFFLRPEVIADAGQVRRLTQDLQAVGAQPDGLPLLLSMDQEGGAVQRLQVGVDPVPSASSVGATGDPGYARRVARDNGTTLRGLGVTMVLAPVAGVDAFGTSELGSRAYSSDPEVVARMVTASVRGYLAAGVVPVVKHFPGLGTVTGDSHTSLPRQEASVKELQGRDLVPFRAAVEAGVPAVMTAHVSVERLERNTPASVSGEVVEGLLREELGFEGVVVTDSHGMAPIHERFGPAEGAVRALAAGNDLVLNSPRPIAAWRAVRAAVEDGTLPAERVVEAATRVLALRMYQQRLPG